MKANSPLLGFNNNVRHRGRVFHIQTEDSGARRPHVITHLFADGGRILKTTKTSYLEHVGSDRMSEVVRGLMKEQHKAMFIALRDGAFDHLFADAPSQPGATPALDGTRGPLPSTTDLPDASAVPREAGPPAPVRAAVADVVSATAATLKISAASRSEDRERSPSEADLDLDTLERAAAEAQTPYFRQIDDLPPPPAAILGKKGPSDDPVGAYRAVSPSQLAPQSPPAAEKIAPTPVQARYAPSRPAPIFTQSRPSSGSISIFGEDLISEKSLDEVILSYLAEDLELPPGSKK